MKENFINLYSAYLKGIEAFPINVELNINFTSFPSFTIVGLADNAVKESKERIIAAINNSGINIPPRKIVINLAPAGIKKEGTFFDLPISLGLLSTLGIVDGKKLSKYIIIGELSLNGDIKRVKGVLPVALLAKESGKSLIIPQDNFAEANIVSGVDLWGIKSLKEIVKILQSDKEQPIRRSKPPEEILFKINSKLDFEDVRGQESAKRAIEVAAAGGHNILMVGPPGAGKSMLASRIPTILPAMNFTESIETTKIYSIVGLLPKEKVLITQRPFRAPHHTISEAGLIGGGNNPHPGEVTLSHNGVLFLDELPEFKKAVIEVLRQPLEADNVTISRVSGAVTYPARFMLVAAMNPCPCGYLTDPQHECTCSMSQIHRYHQRISGPLLDRIDIQIEVPAVNYKELTDNRKGESSETIRNRVITARRLQWERYKGTDVHSNSMLTPKLLDRYGKISGEGNQLLKMAIEKFGISARGYHRILKVARTIADMEQNEDILDSHIAEAIQYRSLDKMFLKIKTI